jgi:rhodanese-related sulfurtransferase
MPLDEKAVAYFEQKLKYETTPFTLDYNIKKGKVVVVDPRDSADWNAGRVPTALSIPLAELESKLGTLPADKTIVVYGWHAACAFGPKAALLLARNGFSAQMLTGGFEAWSRKFPIEK